MHFLMRLSFPGVRLDIVIAAVVLSVDPRLVLWAAGAFEVAGLVQSTHQAR